MQEHRLQTAPLQEKLEKGIKVLDIGCGPGWWSIDMAKRHPNSKFVGLDISDSFPREEFPDNLIFKLANAGQGLPFDDDEFDYVFQRFLVMGLSVDQYTFVVDEIKRVLKPGGTVEILEMVSSYNNPSPYFSKLGHWSKWTSSCNYPLSLN
jgi:ubiquinone/menaquinone biosynthesis C-methylase UbiE